MATSNPRAGRTAGRNPAIPLWCAAVLFSACGCSADIPFAPVEGTVTCKGKPVPHAQVIFYADEDSRGPRATGITDEAGHFRLAADDGRDGAPVGRHRVCVVDTTILAEKLGMHAKQHPDANGKAPASKKPTSKLTIPSEYGRLGETPLRAEVRPGTQTIDFQVP